MYVGESDLSYPADVSKLMPRLQADGVAATTNELLVVSSVGQLLTMLVQLGPVVAGTSMLSVAVEEPGYHAGFNLIESLGSRLIGVQTDDQRPHEVHGDIDLP